MKLSEDFKKGLVVGYALAVGIISAAVTIGILIAQGEL